MGERDKEHFQQGLNTRGSDKCKSLVLCAMQVMGLQQLLPRHSRADLVQEDKRQKGENL